jgi:hypothetical protein
MRAVSDSPSAALHCHTRLLQFEPILLATHAIFIQIPWIIPYLSSITLPLTLTPPRTTHTVTLLTLIDQLAPLICTTHHLHHSSTPLIIHTTHHVHHVPSGMITHENTDISIAAVGLIHEMTDVDTILEEESAMVFIDAFLDCQGGGNYHLSLYLTPSLMLLCLKQENYLLSPYTVID